MIAGTYTYAPDSQRVIVARIKSLLSYGHKSGYLQFNARGDGRRKERFEFSFACPSSVLRPFLQRVLRE
jgi:hypothetical protein